MPLKVEPRRYLWIRSHNVSRLILQLHSRLRSDAAKTHSVVFSYHREIETRTPFCKFHRYDAPPQPRNIFVYRMRACPSFDVSMVQVHV
ncbi:hypothetical protein NP493_467g02016 [Ridgeia piscesae]|uniref:Uncharacterized protein n=1 Tax=Ridgeia piscesae TaxID=27915 RepID=A0AAD9MKI0_RIDPI|nr:hypothetical protein NP493_8343g00004 [Ridgeia piscesae]KAK2179874.1 hypothetical protein NP493_467g02016 [Ridgeia piscesae]